MEYFHLSISQLEKLASDKQRLVLLMMKIHAVDEMLAAKTGPNAAAAPSEPSAHAGESADLGMAARTTTTVARNPDLVANPTRVPVNPVPAKMKPQQRTKRHFWNLDSYMEVYNTLISTRS